MMLSNFIKRYMGFNSSVYRIENFSQILIGFN